MLMNLFVRFEAVRTLLSFALQLAALLFVPAIGSGSVRDVCERARGVTSQSNLDPLSLIISADLAEVLLVARLYEQSIKRIARRRADMTNPAGFQALVA
jgi:hypothetical protein